MYENDDRMLFMAEMADVQPLAAGGRIMERPQSAPSPGQLYRRQAAERGEARRDDRLSLFLKKTVRPDDWLVYRRGGVQDGVFKKLRQGQYGIDATLDLQHRTPEQARVDLEQFVADCLARDIRTALVNHGRAGKGKHALIKSYVAQWLPQLDEVMAFHTARRQHGGEKAVYVLLRKSENLKQKNRERWGGKATL